MILDQETRVDGDVDDTIDGSSLKNNKCKSIQQIFRVQKNLVIYIWKKYLTTQLNMNFPSEY